MSQVVEITQKAIKAFENNDFSEFNKYAKIVFNSFNMFPSNLDTIDHPYLLGVVYYYFEGALRQNENINRVCFENACYCFLRTIKNENLYEKQCAAMRLFLLLHDNGAAAFNLCYSVFQQNCDKLMGVTYNVFKMLNRNDNENLYQLIRQYVRYVQSCCYSIFLTSSNHSSISENEMLRITQLTKSDNYECPNLLGYQSSKEYFFELVYKYLDSEIKMEKGMKNSRMILL